MEDAEALAGLVADRDKNLGPDADGDLEVPLDSEPRRHADAVVLEALFGREGDAQALRLGLDALGGLGPRDIEVLARKAVVAEIVVELRAHALQPGFLNVLN